MLKKTSARAPAGGDPSIHATPVPWVETTPLAIAFDVYNQGRTASQPSHARAFFSDHGAGGAHERTCRRNNEMDLALLSDLTCEGANCTPAIEPGDSASYAGSFGTPNGGFGSHAVTDVLGNQAVENGAGGFSLYSGAGESSFVSFTYGRHLWIDVDSALDADGQTIDEAGQVLQELHDNDMNVRFVDQEAPAFGELTLLSALFVPLPGSNAAVSPRINVHLEGRGVLGIRLGFSPGFGSGPGLGYFSGTNFIGNEDPARYDTSGLTNMPPEFVPDATTEYSLALADAGAFTVERVEFLAGDVAGPAREYYLTQINLATGAITEPTVTMIQSDVDFRVGIAANSTALFWVVRNDDFEATPPAGPPAVLGAVWTSGLDGSNPQVLVPDQARPTRIALDDSAVYWTNQGRWDDVNSRFHGEVRRYDLTTNQVTTIAADEIWPSAIILVAGQPYWFGNFGIRTLEEGVPVSVHNAGGVNLASDGEHLFWTNYGGSDDGKVLQIPIEGGTEIELTSGEYRTWEVKTDGPTSTGRTRPRGRLSPDVSAARRSAVAR